MRVDTRRIAHKRLESSARLADCGSRDNPAQMPKGFGPFHQVRIVLACIAGTRESIHVRAWFFQSVFVKYVFKYVNLSNVLPVQLFRGLPTRLLPISTG